MQTLPEPMTADEVVARAHMVVARRRAQWAAPPAPRPPEPVLGLSRADVAAAVSAPPAAAKTLPRAVPPRVRTILEAVAAETGVPAEAIVSRSRKPAIYAARREAIGRLRAETQWPPGRIGMIFGLDRTTVMHALGLLRRRRAAP